MCGRSVHGTRALSKRVRAANAAAQLAVMLPAVVPGEVLRLILAFIALFIGAVGYGLLLVKRHFDRTLP